MSSLNQRAPWRGQISAAGILIGCIGCVIITASSVYTALKMGDVYKRQDEHRQHEPHDAVQRGMRMRIGVLPHPAPQLAEKAKGRLVERLGAGGPIRTGRARLRASLGGRRMRLALDGLDDMLDDGFGRPLRALCSIIHLANLPGNSHGLTRQEPNAHGSTGHTEHLLARPLQDVYKRQVEKGTVADEAGLHIVGGEYHGFEIVATTAGIGTVNAAAAAQHLISAHGANAIIFSGIAGGLNPALHIGDVVIGEHLRYLDTDIALIAESAPGLEEFSSSDFLVELAEQTLRAHGFVDAALSEDDAATARAEADATLFRRNNTDSEPQRFLRGTIATGDRFVSGAEAKAAAIAATQGDLSLIHI